MQYPFIKKNYKIGKTRKQPAGQKTPESRQIVFLSTTLSQKLKQQFQNYRHISFRLTLSNEKLNKEGTI